MPYYAVMFEQPYMPPDLIHRRLAMVSQSPLMIQQWGPGKHEPAGRPDQLASDPARHPRQGGHCR